MCVFFFEENYKDDCKGDYYQFINSGDIGNQKYIIVSD